MPGPAQFDSAPDTSFSAASEAIYAKALARDGAAAASVVKDACARARHRLVMDVDRR